MEGFTHGQAENRRRDANAATQIAPYMKNDLAKISDFELPQLMVCAYKCAIDVKDAELTKIERRMDETARALFSSLLQ